MTKASVIRTKRKHIDRGTIKSSFKNNTCMAKRKSEEKLIIFTKSMKPGINSMRNS